jgi:hypothetical protein
MMGDFVGTIGHAFVNLVLPSLATVIAGMLVMVLKRVANKYGLEVSEKQEQRLKEIVVDKIHAVEELSRRSTLTSEEKKAIAVNESLKVAIDDPTLPNPSVAHVSSKVDTELAKARVGGRLPSQPTPPSRLDVNGRTIEE